MGSWGQYGVSTGTSMGSWGQYGVSIGVNGVSMESLWGHGVSVGSVRGQHGDMGTALWTRLGGRCHVMGSRDSGHVTVVT